MYVLTDKWILTLKAHSTYDTTYRAYEVRKEGISVDGCFSPALRGIQDICGEWKVSDTRE